MGHARLALTNPGLMAEDWLSMGGRFVDLDPKRGFYQVHIHPMIAN